ncbi:hypothetical protein K490DRAFT_71397 [Saccharata proteae CBS 121410]|uniref:U3 small nucleolar RNA-associated protein 6 N-terminal domain-containing protein n=1 Tax=Saccharata proteae CBS 121410 TaxID=1314787 RepID=A0A9P4I0E1_9PEZI|nr:hypothetical protein K490DRAFT_71397 [Saccharata proteae CBS 121410]
MSATDKARFYLEQSVPELRELERKEIFKREEITAIAKKRSEFEHILNARGSQPADYARYAEYEMNLEALRKKRVKRMGIKAGGHSGQRRIFFILDRATRKFHGDLGLWMQYIEYARKEKANKKLEQILTSLLRMHPTKPELWIYAARYATDAQADMTGARGYMQRGLRFCKSSKLLWLEYAKLEMIYVAKIAARRTILGLDQERKPKKTQTEDDTADDMIALPEITAEDIDPSLAKDAPVDDVALQNLASTPVLTGAIPMAVFDAAMQNFNNASSVGEQFFDMFAEFEKTPCMRTLLQHVLEYLQTNTPTDLATQSCYWRLPLVGVDTSSPDFPRALGTCLERIKESMASSEKKPAVATKAIALLLPLLDAEELDANIRKVLNASLRQFRRNLDQEITTK